MPEDRALTGPPTRERPLRHAIEVRHESFRTPEFSDLLRRHGVALVLADNPGQWPILEETPPTSSTSGCTATSELYASGYSDAALDAWAAKIRGWTEPGQDVYVYCDNDAKVRAPYDAMGLLAGSGLRRAGDLLRALRWSANRASRRPISALGRTRACQGPTTH